MNVEYNRGYNAAIEDLKKFIVDNKNKVPMIFRAKVNELYKALDSYKKEEK